MSAAACETCGHVHASNDARAVGRFGSNVTYVAASAPTPPRATRAEAEADECAWRIERRQSRGAAVTVAPPVRRSAPTEPQPAREPEPFPAVEMETAARGKAWADFLAQVRLSLLVWEIDVEVRDGCEDVLAWIGRCRDDLRFGGAA